MQTQKKYRFNFIGSQSGAIGITYEIWDTYKCDNIHEALSYLYEDYQHFGSMKAYENGKLIELPEKINWVKVRSYRERERSPKTGSYRYYREDAPKDYKY